MKRIRKFNENVSQIDYDYVYSCFGELIDDNKVKIEVIEDISVDIRLTIESQDIMKGVTSRLNEIGDKNSQIYNYIKVHNNNNYLLQELEVGLKRLSDEYPDYQLKFTYHLQSIYIEIFISKEAEKEQYPF